MYYNNQLIRYADYETEKGVISNSYLLPFTKVCQRIGWNGMQFDVLPITTHIYHSSYPNQVLKSIFFHK
ncbi:TPA: nitric oxide synthase oxygenase [Bacillus pseudomycoides]|nr:nitric oxide synthase oxygenase [Bacillus pseudomycoides]